MMLPMSDAFLSTLIIYYLCVPSGSDSNELTVYADISDFAVEAVNEY